MTIAAGLHVNINTLDEYVRKTDMYACQVFVITPLSTRFVKLDIPALKRQIHELDLMVYIHTSYLVSPWGTKPYNMALSAKQLEVAHQIGAKGVIFHVPKVPFRDLVERFKKLLTKKPPRVKVIMENRAAKPNDQTMETPEKVNDLISIFIQNGIPRGEIKLCFDTAHLHSCGTTLRTYKDAREWLGRLKYPRCIISFHLNGSQSDTNSDKHTCPFAANDRIWGGMKMEDSGFLYILRFCKRYNIDVIYEVDYVVYGKQLKKLIQEAQSL